MNITAKIVFDFETLMRELEYMREQIDEVFPGATDQQKERLYGVIAGCYTGHLNTTVH